MRPMFVRAMQNSRTGRWTLLGRYPGTIRRRARVDDEGKVTLRAGDPTGMRATFLDDGRSVRPTAHGQKNIAKRRAKNRVAKQSRKVNRGTR